MVKVPPLLGYLLLLGHKSLQIPPKNPSDKTNDPKSSLRGGLIIVVFISSPASVNVLVPNCKIYNDASCDISADGQLLAVFIPSSQRGFPDEGILAIYSLAPHNLGEMLYTKRFGAVSFFIRF